jgi:hypothetical protein
MEFFCVFDGVIVWFLKLWRLFVEGAWRGDFTHLWREVVPNVTRPP